MTNQQLVKQQIHAVFSEIHYLIRLLYVTHDVYMKNLTLNQLWNKIEQLQFLIRILPAVQSAAPQAAQPIAAAPSAPAAPHNQQTFTREQLSRFDGKNGKPAYVAVNGIVYDVTNNAAWSAASHFGLTAGNELTQEFASCHAAEQWILNTLTPVGRLLD